MHGAAQGVEGVVAAGAGAFLVSGMTTARGLPLPSNTVRGMYCVTTLGFLAAATSLLAWAIAF
jgi:hypothetical protein